MCHFLGRIRKSTWLSLDNGSNTREFRSLVGDDIFLSEVMMKRHTHVVLCVFVCDIKMGGVS